MRSSNLPSCVSTSATTRSRSWKNALGRHAVGVRLEAIERLARDRILRNLQAGQESLEQLLVERLIGLWLVVAMGEEPTQRGIGQFGLVTADPREQLIELGLFQLVAEPPHGRTRREARVREVEDESLRERHVALEVAHGIPGRLAHLADALLEHRELVRVATEVLDRVVGRIRVDVRIPELPRPGASRRREDPERVTPDALVAVLEELLEEGQPRPSR